MNNMNCNDNTFSAGLKACLPTIVGYWSIGFAAGTIGALSDYSLLQVGLLAGLLYAGSAQFLFYAMSAINEAPLAIVFAVFLVNVRYLLMSSALCRFFNGQSMVQKLIGGAFLTDETFGVASQYAKEHGIIPFRWLCGLNIAAYLNWLAANLAGAALASRLPVSLVDGLSFSLTAMFIGLLLLTYFAATDRRRELIAIMAAAGMVVILFQWMDRNIAILIATTLGATVATISLLSRTLRGLLWKSTF